MLHSELLGVPANPVSKLRRHLGQVGSVVFVAGSAFLAWRTWQWSAARYVVTNERVLFIQGIVARQVNGVPLRGVLDTTYHRTLGGRLRGYGALELNISGTPGLRRLVPLRHPDAFYQLILSLIQPGATVSPRAAAETGRAAQRQVTEPRPVPAVPAGPRIPSDAPGRALLSPGAVRA